MSTMSPDVAKRFCQLCNWVYECWLTHTKLFDENDSPDDTIGKAKYFTSRLSIITQEYTLLQICKLHEPASYLDSNNLTIDYIFKNGDWDLEAENMRGLVSELNTLFDKIKISRNKLLAHNDLAAHMADKPMGEFTEGLDKKYFISLQKFVNVVSNKWQGELYPFNDLAGADVSEFLAVLKKA